jgi:hypothetical protein
MAEDDKYVPSEGNTGLDPTISRMAMGALSRALDQEQQAYEKKREDSRASSLQKFNALSSKVDIPDGYEMDDEGVLRNKGYKYTKGYAAKEKTKAKRAHITERTWGKYNRGETQDMYGGRKATPMRQMPIEPPKKKSDIAKSMSPTYGQIALGKFGEMAAGPVASGLMPWISRFNPNVCGPMRVATFGNYGGVIQSNAQEAANNGFPVNLEESWGKA